MASDPRIPSLEWLRKQAKALLRSARAGDAGALRRVGTVPRLAGLDDHGLIASAQLADAQHALAREHGAESWTELKRRVEHAQPLAEQIEQFLTAVREQARVRARRMFERASGMMRADARVAGATGDVAALEESLARDPALATREDAHGVLPLLYVCGSPMPPEDAAVSAALVRCAELLVAAGATANDHMLIGEPDEQAPIPALYFACVSDHRALVRWLLEHGANPNDGESVYHAAELNRTECLELLLAHGADISGTHAHWKNTPLYFLCGYGDDHRHSATVAAGIRWLLEHGADPNVAAGAHPETPLHAAARNGRSAAFAELLLTHGADPNRRRDDGRTPLMLALRTGNEPVAAALRAHGGRVENMSPEDELMGACMRGDEAATRAVLAREPGIVSRLEDEDRDLMTQAAEEGRDRAVRLMVDIGLDPTREGDPSGTPLHRAAWHGRVETVRVLLELGAPLDTRDRQFGSSPLGWAAHGSTYCRSADDDYCAVVTALIDAGARPEPALNQWEEGPVSMASPAVAALLRSRGFER